MRFYTKALTILLCCASLASQAEEGTSSLYYGLEIGNGKYETSSTTDDTLRMLSGTLGIQVGSFLALEGRFGLASNGRSSLVSDPQVMSAAALLRLNYTGNNLKTYLAAGYGAVNSDFLGATKDDDGLVAGLGVELFGNERTALSLSYTHYERSDAKLDYSVANIGFKHYFATQF